MPGTSPSTSFASGCGRSASASRRRSPRKASRPDASAADAAGPCLPRGAVLCFEAGDARRSKLMIFTISHRRPLTVGIAAASLLAASAAAHHGWSWAEDEQTELTGTILEIYIGPPHPTLEVETADDGV